MEKINESNELNELNELNKEAMEMTDEVSPIEKPQELIEEHPKNNTKFESSVCVCGSPMTCTRI